MHNTVFHSYFSTRYANGNRVNDRYQWCIGRSFGVARRYLELALCWWRKVRTSPLRPIRHDRTSMIVSDLLHTHHHMRCCRLCYIKSPKVNILKIQIFFDRVEQCGHVSLCHNNNILCPLSASDTSWVVTHFVGADIGVNHPAIVREIPHFYVFPAFPHFSENVPHVWL